MTSPTEDGDLFQAAEASAEDRREAQRQGMRAARRARAVAVAPWAGAVVLAAAAVACAVAASAPLAVPGAPGSAGTASPVLKVDRVLASAEATQGAPTGVAVSGDRVYVADPTRGSVSVLDRDGNRLATIGAGFLRTPVYVAVGPVDGRIYVSDRGRGQVVVFAQDGTRFGTLSPMGLRPGNSRGGAWRPLAIAFAPDGTLYVADSGPRQVIDVFSPAGSRIATIGADAPIGRTGQRLAFVNGIVASADRVVVADSNNGRLLVFGRDGSFRSAIPRDGLPRGLAVTDAGRILVTGVGSPAVTVLSASGAPMQQLAGGVGERERFASPAGMATARDGSVYVADSGSGRVFVLRTGDGAIGGRAAAAMSRTLEIVFSIIAAVGAAALAAFGVVRARARVREAGVTL